MAKSKSKAKVVVETVPDEAQPPVIVNVVASVPPKAEPEQDPREKTLKAIYAKLTERRH